MNYAPEGWFWGDEEPPEDCGEDEDDDEP